MKTRLFISLLSASAILLGASISFAQHDNAKDAQQAAAKYIGRPNEMAKAPEKYRSKTNPMNSDPTAPVAGKILFKEHCATCHGKDADGTRRGPSMMRDRVQTATPGAIFWVVTNGIVCHGMPVWSKLPEPERWQIVSYIKSLGSSTVAPDPSRPQASIVAPR